MTFEKMLMGYATLDKPDALLLRELANQNMEVGNLLVRSRKTMIYDKMDSLRVPDLLNTHLTEDLDRQGSRAILGHSHIGRQNRDFARMVNLLASFGFNAVDLIRLRQRVVIDTCCR